MSNEVSPDVIVQFHIRLIAGDPTVSGEIAESLLPEISAFLVKSFPNISDPDLIDTAAIDTIMSYLTRPEQYNPNFSTLDKYLKYSAKYDLYNLMHQGKLEQIIVSLTDDVELEGGSPEYGIEIRDEQNVEEEVDRKDFASWLQITMLLPNPMDQELLLMMMDGVRETTLYAAVLGIEQLPEEEQAIIAKRQKDRIKKVIQRHIRPEDLKR